MAVRQVMSITEETQEPTVEALTVRVLQMTLTMLVHVEMVQQKALQILVLQIRTVDIIILVLREQVAHQKVVGQVEVETLHQEVHRLQTIIQEAHRLQAHQAGVVVVHLLRAVAEPQEAHHQVVEVAAVEVAVGQDNLFKNCSDSSLRYFKNPFENLAES